MTKQLQILKIVLPEILDVNITHSVVYLQSEMYILSVFTVT